MLVEAIILQCSLNIKGERTNSSIYHILQGKKSIQTVQDIQVYQLERYYGIHKSLTKYNFEKKINGLINNGFLEQISGTETFYSVSKSGKEWLDKEGSNRLIQYYNGLKYYDVADAFLERLFLLIQTVTNTKMKHYSFIPVIDSQSAERWVKAIYRKKKNQESQLLKTIFHEITSLLQNLTSNEAEMFVDRLTGYQNYGMNIYQLAVKYDMTSEEVKLQFTGITHRLLDLIYQTKTDLPLMSYCLEGISTVNPITNSANKTYDLLKKGYSTEKIAQIRRLKVNTIYDHIVEIALYETDFSISNFVSETDQKKIINAFRLTKSYKLKDIKQLVDEEITYFQIRLVLAIEINLKGV